jgi:uroporphyrinogen-III decarboxylase
VADFMDITPGECRFRCVQLLEKTGTLRYMLSAGCEIPVGVTDEVFDAFCEAPRKSEPDAPYPITA